jgi:hypothetical protein|tara:strand:+ start:1079 stop:1354 length:276 start_codon:yes stop_codon:yes gene_type:complete
MPLSNQHGTSHEVKLAHKSEAALRVVKMFLTNYMGEPCYKPWSEKGSGDLRKDLEISADGDDNTCGCPCCDAWAAFEHIVRLNEEANGELQ